MQDWLILNDYRTELISRKQNLQILWVVNYYFFLVIWSESRLNTRVFKGSNPTLFPIGGEDTPLPRRQKWINVPNPVLAMSIMVKTCYTVLVGCIG